MISEKRSLLDQFGLSRARVERVSLDERLNTARQVRHKIYKNALNAARQARDQRYKNAAIPGNRCRWQCRQDRR